MSLLKKTYQPIQIDFYAIHLPLNQLGFSRLCEITWDV